MTMEFNVFSLLTIYISIVYVFADSNFNHVAVDHYIEDAVATLKLKIHQASQKYGNGRSRRSILNPQKNNNSSSGYVLLISSIKPVARLPNNHTVKIQPFKIDGVQYLAVVNFAPRETSVASEVYRWLNGGFVLVQKIEIPGCVDFNFVDYGDKKYAVFVEKVNADSNGKLSYDRAYHIFEYQYPTFRRITNVAMHGGTSVKSFLNEKKNYFVAANSLDRFGRRTLKSTVHVKTMHGLILIQEIETHCAEDVEVFKINDLVHLVFANHMDDNGMVDIYSPLYRQRRKQGPDGYIVFEQIQGILTHGARDFEYFKMKNHHYIVVANEYTQLIGYEVNPLTGRKQVTVNKDYETESVIYWWSGRFFVEWQRISTNGARKWSHFNGPNGETFLIVSNSKSQAVIYIYDPALALFKPTRAQGLSPAPSSSKLPDVRAVKAFSFGNKTFLAVANYNESGGYNIFSLTYTYEERIAKEKPNVKQLLRAALGDVSARMEKMNSWLEKIRKKLVNVMTLKGNETVYGENWFRNITIKKLRVKGNVLYKNHLESNPIERAVQHAMQIKRSLTLQSNVITELQRRLNDSVSRTGTNNITGTKTFTGNVSFGNVTIHEMHVDKIDGVNITDLEQRAWSKSKPQDITGRNVFKVDVKMLKDVTVAGTVNGIRIPEDVMTRHTDQHLNGKKMFTEPVKILGNMQMINATVNGIKIPEDLVLRGNNQLIEGKKTFNGDVKFEKSVLLKGKVNGEDLSEFSKRVVTLSTDQIITGSKTFVDGFSVGGNLNVTGLVDGVDLEELDLDAVRVDEEETIRGMKTVFGSVIVNGSVETLSTTNGHRLQDDVMTTATDQVINVAKTFSNITVQGNIVTTSTIDGIDLSQEAVTKSGDQTINGKKTFKNDIGVNGDITVAGTVDGVDLSELDRTVVKLNGNNIITAPKTFTGKVTVKNISILGDVNNINLRQLRENIWTVDGNHTITVPMSFESVKLSSNLDVYGTVNGVKIPEDLVPSTEPQVLEGNVTFNDRVTFEGGIQFGPNSSINGENFPEFMNSVVLNGTKQVIYGKKIIANDGFSVENDLIVNGKINGFKIPEDFVTLNTMQDVSGIKTFRGGITANGPLSTGIIDVSSTVNGVDISELEATAVYKGKNQTIYGTVTFTGNVSSAGSVTVAKLIDGVNITELAETAVRLSKPQNISGNKVFTKDIEFYSPLASPGLVNNIDLRKLDSNSLKKTGQQHVTGEKVFIKPVFIAENLNNGTINGINLKDFRNEVVTKDGIDIINGNLQFLNNITCDSMVVEGKVDELKLQELMLTSGDQVIYGNKVFAGDVTLKKNLQVDGLINNVNLTELNSEMMKVNENQNVWATLVFKKGFHANRSIDISGFVNWVDISDVSARAVRIDGTGMIGGNKKFTKDVIVHGNVQFEEKVNGFDITDLFSDVMSKTENQVIPGKKIFVSDTRVTEGLVAEDVEVNGLIDGVNITALDKHAVKLSTDQALFGNYTFLNRTDFTNGIQVNGLLNGINVSSDVMLTHSDQTVTGRKSFRKLVVNGSIQIDGKIDGVDVSEFARSRVTLSTNQTIYGKITFDSNVTVQGDIHLPENGTINGIDVSEDILTTQGPLVVVGEKTFVEDLNVDSDFNVTGLVNGLDVAKLNRDIVLVDEDTELKGVNIFTKNLTIRGNLYVDGYVNGVKLELIANKTEQLKKHTKRQLGAINGTSLPICSQIKVLLNLSGIQIQLAGIEKSQIFPISNGGDIDAHNIGDYVYVTVARALASGCGPAYILRCSSTLLCTIHQVIKTQARYMQFYEVSGKYFVFVGHFGSNKTGCPYYPEILKFDESKQLFTSLHNITSSLYASLSAVSSNDVIVQNIVSLIPQSLLTNCLCKSPITALGSQLKSPAVMSRTFRRNGTVYLVTVSIVFNVYSINLFILNTTTLKTTKLQSISTREVNDIDTGLVDGKIMLAVAEGRGGNNYEVKFFAFGDPQEQFFFYQRIELTAVSLRLKTIQKNFYLVFASPDNGFGLCPWRGVMGFETCMTVPEAGIKHITVITTQNNGVVTLGIKDSVLVLHKAIFQGITSKYNGTLNC